MRKNGAECVIVHIHENEYVPNSNEEMRYKIKNETEKCTLIFIRQRDEQTEKNGKCTHDEMDAAPQVVWCQSWKANKFTELGVGQRHCAHQIKARLQCRAGICRQARWEPLCDCTGREGTRAHAKAS